MGDPVKMITNSAPRQDAINGEKFLYARKMTRAKPNKQAIIPIVLINNKPLYTFMAFCIYLVAFIASACREGDAVVRVSINF